MAAADEDLDTPLLTPQWLRDAHGLHSPGKAAGSALAGLREGGSRQGRNSSSNSSIRGSADSPLLQLQHPRSSNGHSLTTAHSEERPGSWSPRTKPSQHGNRSFMRSSSSGQGSSSSRVLFDERHSSVNAFGSSSSFLGTRQHERPHLHVLGPTRGHAAATGHAAASGSGPRTPTGSSSSSGAAAQAAGKLSSLHRAVSEDSSLPSWPTAAGASSGGHHQMLHSNGAAAVSGDDKLLWRDSRRHAAAAAALPGSVSSSVQGSGKPGKQQLSLSPLDFPSLGASSGASSSPHSSNGRHGSPEPYTPSLAPYKQDFLASRGTSGWTSKLADVPLSPTPSTADVGCADKGQQPQESSAAAAAAAAAADGGSSKDAGSQGEAASGQGAASGARATAWGSAAGVAGVATDTAADNPANAAAGAGAQSSAAAAKHPSLADTLKQAAATNSSPAAAAEALHRRHNKTLVPLLPGCKAKHGSSTTRTATATTTAAGAAAGGLKLSDVVKPTGRGRAAAAAGGGGAAGVVDLLQSPTGHTALLKLNHSSTSAAAAPASASAVTASSVASKQEGAGGALPAVAAEAQVQFSVGSTGSSGSSQSAAAAAAPAAGVAAVNGAHGPQCKLPMGSAGEQRQQLRDRNSFFAVLRRKTSSSGDGGQAICTGIGGSSSSSHTAQVVAGTATAGIGDAPATAVSSDDDVQHVGDAVDQYSTSSRHSSTQVGSDQRECSTEQQQHQQGKKLERQVHEMPAEQQQHSSPAVAEASNTSPSKSQHSSSMHSASSLAAGNHVSSTGPGELDSNNLHNAVSDAASTRGSGGCGNGGSSNASSDAGADRVLWELPEEEEAFLRSLGWTAVSSDDDEEWGLTEEEIAAFQAAAAARAAQQQQQHGRGAVAGAGLAAADGLVGGYQSVLQMQQQKAQAAQAACGLPGKRFGGCVGGVRAGVGAGGHRVVRGGQGQRGMLLGVYLPAADLLGFDSYDGSSSSSSDDEGDS